MTDAVRSELLKACTTRAWYVYLAALVLLAGLTTAAVVASTSGPDSSERLHADLIETLAVAGLLAIVFGITHVTAEFRHGTITPTVLATPRRERVLAAKAVAVAVISSAFALAALVTISAVALPWRGSDIHLADAELATSAVEAVGGVVLAGLLGLAIGSVVHGQVAALVGTLVWFFLVEAIAIGLLGLADLDGVGPYLPFQALDAADGTGGGDLLSYGAGLAVSVAWIAAVGTVGVVRTVRRDLT